MNIVEFYKKYNLTESQFYMELFFCNPLIVLQYVNSEKCNPIIIDLLFSNNDIKKQLAINLIKGKK